MAKRIYCDGSCINNGKPGAYGGWAAVQVKGESLDDNDLINVISGPAPENPEIPVTNIRMELKAVIEGLKSFTEPTEILLHTDSAYVVNGIRQKWYKKWFTTGKTSTGRAPKNIDLWTELVKLLMKHDVKAYHVKGHSGHKWQEMCDTLAKEQAYSTLND